MTEGQIQDQYSERAPPEDYDLEEIAAECRQIAADQARAAANAARLGATGALAAIGAMLGRRGPGQPGSARIFPGEYTSRAAQFATGVLMDVMPGRPELAGFADEAAGDDDTYDGASDDEVVGALCAWDRLETRMAARKHAVVAELIRRRPKPGCTLGGTARMPAVWAWEQRRTSGTGSHLSITSFCWVTGLTRNGIRQSPSLRSCACFQASGLITFPTLLPSLPAA